MDKERRLFEWSLSFAFSMPINSRHRHKIDVSLHCCSALYYVDLKEYLKFYGGLLCSSSYFKCLTINNLSKIFNLPLNCFIQGLKKNYLSQTINYPCTFLYVDFYDL